MFFLQRRRRPALARVVRNSNATLWRYGRREYDMEAGADGRTAMTSPMERPSWTDCSDRRAPHAVSSTLDAVLGRVHDIPPVGDVASERLSHGVRALTVTCPAYGRGDAAGRVGAFCRT